MRCIFCTKDSSESTSVEHIIPESFGNTTAILPKGIVCDKCNNYFARKVEGPFLNSDVILRIRQELEIENKKGKLITDFSYPRVGKEYVKQITKDIYWIYSREEKTEQELATDVKEYCKYMQETDRLLLQPNIHVSRMLAKIAVEFFVKRSGDGNDVCEYVINDDIFRAIREYSRYGSRNIWPYSSRRIYSRNEAYNGDPFSSINWEADFLFLESGDVYLVIAMFGIEYAINIIRPNLECYLEWLRKNKNFSPLYLTVEKREKNFINYARVMFSEEEFKSFLKSINH